MSGSEGAGTLVVRFSSMGDVVLAGAVTGPLAPVSFLTKAAWAPLAARLPGVEQVYAWEEVVAGRQALPRRWARIVDLHRNLRSRRLSLPGGPALEGQWSRVERHDLRRRLRVWLKVGDPPPTVIERYARAAGVTPAARPWIGGWHGGETLVLAPGAAHATKRWPAERWGALGTAWPGPVAVLGGPGDRALLDAVVDAVGSRAHALAERGFDQTIETLRTAALAVAGDTGLMHLAGAMGVPVVGLFGPTTAADGFWDPRTGQAVEVDLPCRPCSLHGGPTCPIGDHLCMEAISVDAVLAAMQAVQGAAP